MSCTGNYNEWQYILIKALFPFGILGIHASITLPATTSHWKVATLGLGSLYMTLISIFYTTTSTKYMDL